MAVKRIKFYNLTTTSQYLGFGNLDFFDKNENRIILGITISEAAANTIVAAGKTNFTVPTKNYGNITVNVGSVETGGMTDTIRIGRAAYAFCDDADTVTANSSESVRRNALTCSTMRSGNFYEIIFETPIEFAYMNWTTWIYTNSSTYVNLTSPYAIEIEDEFGTIIYDKRDLNPTKAIFAKSYLYLDVEEKSYITNSPQRVITTANSRVSSIDLINAIKVDQTEPSNTQIRYALSFGGRNYVKFDKTTKQWVNLANIEGSTILSDGMSKAELEDLLSVDFYKTNGHQKGESIDVALAMMTTNEKITPKVTRFKILGYNETSSK